MSDSFEVCHAELGALVDSGAFKEGGLCFEALATAKADRTPEQIAALVTVHDIKMRMKACL